jgi:DNA-binding FrmR family transcriptional regulator
MPEEENVVNFIGEQFRRLNPRLDKMEERLGRIEGQVVNVERRLTAMSHFDQSIVAHVASIHSGVDNLRADFIAVEQRLSAVEAR